MRSWKPEVLAILLLCGTACTQDTESAPEHNVADAGIEDAAQSDVLVPPSDAGDGAWHVEDYFQQSPIGEVEPYEQRRGDAAAGYDYLINEGYISCGIPARLFDILFAGQEVPPEARLPGRRPPNDVMAPSFTRFDRDGIELVSTNCLSCHANVLPTGEFMIGLGYEGDHTQNLSFAVGLGRNLVDEDNQREVEEYDRFLERTAVLEPYVVMSTIGVNPADNIAGVLTAHRDPDTWEWLPEPWFELPDVIPVPISVPPWWHARKKNALYWSAVGHGDHARFMMAAALLCTDSIEEAREIDANFVDVAAYINTIEAPQYPYPVDAELAADGQAVFESTCSRCHGTYGDEETYPNLIVDLDEVGTDPMLAQEGALAARPAVAWLNRSFFGELSAAAPAQGYMAPPLDGVWATAPYFHNGSVPTVDAVIDSSKRPTYWTRDFTVLDYDPERVGFVHFVLSGGKDSVTLDSEKRAIYDTSQPGYSNAGHTFGDELGPDQKTALLEYLKTL